MTCEMLSATGNAASLTKICVLAPHTPLVLVQPTDLAKRALGSTPSVCRIATWDCSAFIDGTIRKPQQATFNVLFCNRTALKIGRATREVDAADARSRGRPPGARKLGRSCNTRHHPNGPLSVGPGRFGPEFPHKEMNIEGWEKEGTSEIRFSPEDAAQLD